MAYNSFGLTVEKVANYFVTGCTTQSSIIDQLGGADIIKECIDDVVYEVVGSMCGDVLNKINLVQLEQLNPDGGLLRGKSTLTLGFKPVSSVQSLWEFSGYPSMVPDTQNDLETSQYNVNIDGVTGEATLTKTNGENWGEGSYYFATYNVDVESELFQINSIASVIKLGVISRIGPKIYSDEQEWKYLEKLGSQYNKRLMAISDCEWIPDELRNLNWWRDPSRSGALVSIPWYRS